MRYGRCDAVQVVALAVELGELLGYVDRIPVVAGAPRRRRAVRVVSVASEVGAGVVLNDAVVPLKPRAELAQRLQRADRDAPRACGTDGVPGELLPAGEAKAYGDARVVADLHSGAGGARADVGGVGFPSEELGEGAGEVAGFAVGVVDVGAVAGYGVLCCGLSCSLEQVGP